MANREEIIQDLLSGKVVGIPTDTVYGLAALPTNAGRELLAKTKNNQKDKKYSMVLQNKAEARMIFAENKTALKLVEEFLPGPLTIIADSKGVKIGIRVQMNFDTQDIITQTGPLFLTSANFAGEEVITDPTDIANAFGINVLDGEPIEGEASTIVEVVGSDVKIIRDGKISLQEIKEVL